MRTAQHAAQLYERALVARPQGRTRRAAWSHPEPRDVLAMVEDQFVEIRKELGIQLSRMGQIQAQLDQIHGMIKKLIED